MRQGLRQGFRQGFKQGSSQLANPQEEQGQRGPSRNSAVRDSAAQPTLKLKTYRAWTMAEAGLGHLMQRRVAEGRCAYLLIVRARPRSARSTAGCALADLLHREVA